MAVLLLGLAPPAGIAGPRTESSEIPGLSRPVRIVVDHWGVPHIYARNAGDLFLAQGFTAARDRLFQMDVWRRSGLGLLSEILGPSFVRQDRAARLLLYRGDMEREWAAYGPEAKLAVTRFTEGINAQVDWLERHPENLPPEFREFGFAPSRWRPEDVVRIRKHGLSMNAASEVFRSRLVCAGGIGAGTFSRALQPAHTPAVPDGLDPCSVPADVLEPAGQADRQPAPAPPGTAAMAEGSNGWVVAPARTATGRPVLANDPHRALTAPPLRYISHLSTPGLDVIGAGEPFLPGVSLGHNETVAFGLTVFGIDQEDLYVYRLDPGSPGRYGYRGAWEPFRTVTEEVPVAGGPPQRVELQFTRHGPVLRVDGEHHVAYALRTTWTEPGTAPYLGSLRYLRARDFGEFAAALRHWGGPPENHLYADTGGNIGWVTAGLAPKRSGYDGLLPAPGDGRYEWTGFHDGATLPRSYNPPDGFIASANDYNVPAGHPFQVGYEWEPPYRRQRIDDVLSAGRRQSVDDSVRLQNDQLSLPALRLLPLVTGLRSTDPGTGRALDLLRGYDGVAQVDSAATALYEPWFTNHLVPAFLRVFLNEEAASLARIPGGNISLMLEALEHPGEWFGPGGAAARDRLLLTTLGAAYADVRGKLGDDPGKWRWGTLQHTVFLSTTGRHVGPVERGGSGYTVDVSSYNPATYEQGVGASFKMALDVGHWDDSKAINAPGQSGDVAGPHYRDLLEGWRTGTYFPLLYSRAAVERNAESVLTLLPGA
ncbi:penicillin acylase family protein [Amycolatopsis balhimycina]|uniref:penicillin acylase family protein n=1 Tax=Amycolatopsis balhimycina TaxID=208443 RepID=UPI0003693341|nr:penicillin acylase family protein [Amycolatopsis balhimycina]